MADKEELTLTVKSDTKGAVGPLEDLRTSIGKMAAGFTLGTLAVEGIHKAISFVTGTISDSIGAYTQSENVAAQLNATLESTGHAAGMSAQELLNLSSSLQSVTTYDDETVQSAENLLLTFTSIGRDVFPQATEAVLNMSTALGQDTASSAIQLGKALQDPIIGVGALRRVGVNFSESQQEMIKTMVQTNHTLDAQKFILAELDKEFGGSAVAAAKTFEGQLTQLKNKLDDVEEGVGHGLTGALSGLMVAFNKTSAEMGVTIDLGRVTFNIMRYIEEGVTDVAVGVYALATAFVVMGSYVAQASLSVLNFSESVRKGFSDFRENAVSNLNVAKEFALNLHDANNQTALSFDDMTVASGKFKVQGPSAYEATAKAAADAANKIKEANKAIEDTQTKISELDENYLSSAKDTATSYAEAYVEQEQKVADLKSQIRDEDDRKKVQILRKQLKDEEAALRNASAIKTGLSAEVAEAERRAKETDFARTIEDIAKKQIEEQKAYLKKKLALLMELKDNMDKRDALGTMEAQTTAVVQAEAVKRTAIIDQEAAKQIKTAQRVQSAFQTTYSMNINSLTSGSSSPSSKSSTAGSTPMFSSSHEFGGTVPGLPGEPKLILAHGGEQVISGKASSGNGIGTIINNITVNGDTNPVDIVAAIDDYMRPFLQNVKIKQV